MKYLPRFEYIVPNTVAELCTFLDQHGDEARILAGGTDLLIGLKKGELAPRYLVDITRIDELRIIRENHLHISIGATATHTQLAESELIRREIPFLAEAAASIGSVQIRNSGTVGGNVANASPAGDTIPPLAALNATVRVLSREGERHILLSQLFSGPYQTTLSSKEVLAGVMIEKLPPRAGTCFLKLGRRRALTISRISIAVALVLRGDGRIEEARICPGAVTPAPCRIGGAEKVVIGSYPGVELFEKAGRAVAEEMVRISGRRSSTAYKEPVVNNLVQRALSIAVERCEKSRSNSI